MTYFRNAFFAVTLTFLATAVITAGAVAPALVA